MSDTTFSSQAIINRLFNPTTNQLAFTAHSTRVRDTEYSAQAILNRVFDSINVTLRVE